MAKKNNDVDPEIVQHMREAAYRLKERNVPPAEAASILRQYVDDQIDAAMSEKPDVPKAN